MNERITTAGIVRKGDLYLVGKRATAESVNDGKWEFIGGKNRYGESEEETLVREFREELGVTVRPQKLVLQLDFVNNDTLYHLKAYSAELESEDFSLSVHSEAGFKPLDEIAGLDMVESDKIIVNFLIHGRL